MACCKDNVAVLFNIHEFASQARLPSLPTSQAIRPFKTRPKQTVFVGI